MLRDIPEPPVGQVAHVHDHVQALHLGQKFKPAFLQAGLGVGLAGPDVPAPAGHHIGAGQLVFVVPGQGHHAGTQLIHLPQHTQAALAAAALLDGQHSADLSGLRVAADVLRAVDRRDLVGILRHDPLEHIHLFQRRHQRVCAGGRVAQVHKSGKALQHVVALMQLFQINVQIIGCKALGFAPPLGIAQFAQGITMEIKDFHNVSSFLLSFLRTTSPSLLRNAASPGRRGLGSPCIVPGFAQSAPFGGADRRSETERVQNKLPTAYRLFTRSSR